MEHSESDNSLYDSFADNVGDIEADGCLPRLRDWEGMPRPNYRERESSEFYLNLMVADCVAPGNFKGCFTTKPAVEKCQWSTK